MPIISIRIPQMGEGLQEARLVAVLKQPGDRVRRDEPIYQMETDKAVLDVESAHEGVIVEWLAKVDDILPIGAEVAKMDVVGEVVVEATPEAPTETLLSAPTLAPTSRNAAIPPRTRAYAKEKGVTEEQLNELAAKVAKLMPTDIDAFLANQGDRGYDEHPISSKQRVLNSRMVRATQLVVPGSLTVEVCWESLERERDKIRQSGSSFQPSAFTLFAYAIALATRQHAYLRTVLAGDDTFRTYKNLNLGIAVGLPGDELVLAVIDKADTLTWEEFATAARDRIEEARKGHDQAKESVTLSLTNMQAYGVRNAIPVVVPPASSTLFLGEAHYAQDPASAEPKLRRVVNLTMTFDHRVMNGVGAAEFLNTARKLIENLEF